MTDYLDKKTEAAPAKPIYVQSEEQKKFQDWLDRNVGNLEVGLTSRREQIRKGPMPSVVLGWVEIAFLAGYSSSLSAESSFDKGGPNG